MWDSDTSLVKIELTDGNWEIQATNEMSSPLEMTGFENAAQRLCLKTNQLLSVRMMMLSALASKADFRGKVRWYFNDVLSANDTIGFIHPNKTGTYRAALIFENGTIAFTDTVILYAVERPAVNDKLYSFCKNEQTRKLEATASGGNTLAWFNAQLESLGLQSPQPSTAVARTTSFHVAQVDGNGCSSDTVSIAVWIREIPPPPQVMPLSYCQYQQANPLDATSALGHLVKWVDTITNLPFGGSIKPVPSTQIPGTFKYICYTQDTLTGCFSAASTLEVVVHPKPSKPMLDSILICEGAALGSKAISNITGHSYKWYHPDQKPIATSNNSVGVSTTAPGIFKFLLRRVELSTQCESDLSKAVVAVIPLPAKPILEQRSPGELSLSPSLQAVWYRNYALINSYVAPTLKLSLPGVYSASFISRGCIGETSNNFNYLISSLTIGQSNRLIIYPNPVQRYLNVELSATLTGKTDINLFNSSGQLVKIIRGVTSRSLIDLAGLSHGIYFLTTFSEGKLIYKVKFIKE